MRPPDLWPGELTDLRPQSQESVKSLLLQAVGTDPSRLVRIAVAALIAKLAKSLFMEPQGWQEVSYFAFSVWKSRTRPNFI